MAQQTIGGSDNLDVGRGKINDNFTEVYTDIEQTTIIDVTGTATLDSTAFGKIHLCTGTTSDYAVTLLTAAGHEGKSIAFKGDPALTKVVTITPDGSETIDGRSTLAFTTKGIIVIISDGTNWRLVAEVGSWIPWTPTFTGFSADPSGVNAEYFRVGNKVDIRISMSAGTSNATTYTFTLPFNSAIGQQFISPVMNNGTFAAGRITMAASSNILTLFATAAGGAFTASGNKASPLNLTYKCE